MEITDVRIRKVSDEGKMKAIVSITFDDEFVVAPEANRRTKEGKQMWEAFVADHENQTIIPVEMYAQSKEMCEAVKRELGVDAETAAEDACKLEHHISDITYEAIKKHIGM